MNLGSVEFIHCNEIDGKVLTRGVYNELEITALGEFTKRESVDLAPSDCPLLPSDFTRWVGRFGTCLDCPRATVSGLEVPDLQTDH